MHEHLPKYHRPEPIDYDLVKYNTSSKPDGEGIAHLFLFGCLVRHRIQLGDECIVDSGIIIHVYPASISS